MTASVTLDKVGITIVLNRLAKGSTNEARLLYGKLMSSWGHRPDRQRVCISFNEPEMQALKNLDLPGGILTSDVVASGWYAIYRHPRKPKLEVRVRSKQKPPKKRTFTIGSKQVRLTAVSVTRSETQENSKEAVRMATKSKKKVVEDDEFDELEGLEDLDDLEDLEDEEEPEDEEVEEDEDEEPAPKRTRARKAAAKPAAKTRTRKAKVVEPDEDDEEDEDEEEEPAPKKAASKKSASTKGKPAAKKSSNGGGLPTTRELPAGKLGPQDIADMVGDGCDARYVRIHLRNNEYERPEGGRWAFGKRDAASLVKEIKAARKG